ncbi:hypothetical protein SESBI_38550 [Sesbania bispinosa]|nr:hypothetical protein SESBI_38550 [Sesbania bispinosa]
MVAAKDCTRSYEMLEDALGSFLVLSSAIQAFDLQNTVLGSTALDTMPILGENSNYSHAFELIIYKYLDYPIQPNQS